MNRSLRRAGAAAAATLLLLVAPGFADPAHAAAGTISGKLVAADGTPAEGVNIQLYKAPDIEFVDGTSTLADGTYTFPAAAGDYYVEFSPLEQPSQWAYGKTSPWDADVITVTDGLTTVVNETLLAVGEVSGTVRYADGSPALGLEVRASSDTNSFAGWAQTDESGNYRLRAYAGDTYQISYELPENPSAVLYAPGTLSIDDAGRYPFTAGGTTTVDITLPAIGGVSGRFTDEQGRPVANADVSAFGVDHQSGGWTTTDANGEYRIGPIFASSYHVQFSTDNWTRIQYAYGKNRFEDADAIQVTGGADTVVNDSLLGSGSIRVRATDSSTGAPIAGICGNHGPAAGDEEVCATGTELILNGYPAGVNSTFIWSSAGTYFAEEAVFTAVAGQRVDVAVALRPAAAVSTRVVDARTGAPVADACLHLALSDRAVIGEGNTNCTDANGLVRVDSLEPGSYKAFVRPQAESGYGAQWVGRTGGTGEFRAARVITAEARGTVDVPTIRLDRAGTITGTVTDVAGQPATRGLVTLTGYHPGTGPSLDFRIDDQGRYTVTGLGPYAWPLLFNAFDSATQWSGGTANRNRAELIPVTAGASTTYNMVLQLGTTISGTLTKGATPASGWVIAYNANTGDPIGSGWADNGQYRFNILWGQPVKIRYDGSTNDQDSFGGWYDGATSFDTATPVTVTKRPITIAITHVGVSTG